MSGKRVPELFQEVIESHQLVLGESRSFEDDIPEQITPHLSQLGVEVAGDLFIAELKEYLEKCLPTHWYQVLGTLYLFSALQIDAMYRGNRDVELGDLIHKEESLLALRFGFFTIGSCEGYLVAYSVHDKGVYQLEWPSGVTPLTGENLQLKSYKRFNGLEDLAKQALQQFRDELAERESTG